MHLTGNKPSLIENAIINNSIIPYCAPTAYHEQHALQCWRTMETAMTHSLKKAFVLCIATLSILWLGASLPARAETIQTTLLHLRDSDWSFSATATGDLNRDGAQDILVSEDNWLSQQTNALLLGLGSNATQDISAPGWSHSNNAAINDFTGDGYNDFVSQNNKDSKLLLFASTGNATFNPLVIASNTSGNATISAANLDGDTDIDFFVATDSFHTGGPALYWYENLAGGAAWGRHTILSDTGGYGIAATMADIDADSVPDLVVGKANGVFWLENALGDGSSWTAHTVHTFGAALPRVAAVDVDGDTDLDIVSLAMGVDSSVTVQWHRNDSLSWTTTNLVSATSAGPDAYHNRMAVGDIEGDGKPDVVLAVKRGGALYLEIWSDIAHPAVSTILLAADATNVYCGELLMTDKGIGGKNTLLFKLYDYNSQMTTKLYRLAHSSVSGPTLDSGAYHTLAIKQDSSLWAWGRNNAGQLGDGTQINRNAPVRIGDGYVAVSAGMYHSLGLQADSTLWAWGLNNVGQLGTGANVYNSATPALVGDGFMAMAAGGGHSLGLKTDGSLWAWGDNEYGQLGVPVVQATSPVKVGDGFAAVAAAGISSYGLKDDGTLWAWGDNQYGQLGDGTTTTRDEPVLIGSGFKTISAGDVHCLALKTDGSLWAWGWNEFGQLGDGTTTQRNAPVLIGTGFTAISAGAGSSLALKANGTLWAWGRNAEYQLGDGTTTQRNTPVLVGQNYSVFSAGPVFTIAIKTDGTRWAWGDNTYGQLGDGTNTASPSPVQTDTGYAAPQDETGSKGFLVPIITLLLGSQAPPAFQGVYDSQFGTAGTGNGQFNGPAAVAVAENGTIYVTDRGNDRVQRFDSSGNYLGQWGGTGTADGAFNYPNGIAVDASGSVYVCDTENNRIQKFTATGGHVLSWGSPGTGTGQFDAPYGVAADASGNIYVAEWGNSRVQKFTSTGAYLTYWGGQGSADGEFNGAYAVTVDGSGVFVTDDHNNRVQKFTLSGSQTMSFGTFGTAAGQFNEPEGVAVAANGDILVCDNENNRVQWFNSAGQFKAFLATAGSGNGQVLDPRQIAFGPNGKLYVADKGNNRILVFK